MAEQKETIILDFQIEQGDAISELEKTKKSIIQLKQEQQELNKAYKSGNVTLDEYASEQVRLEGILKKQTNSYNTVQKSVTGVKTQFDKLIDTNKGIQKSLENSAQSLDKLIPGFSGVAGQVQSATAASKAFIATPLGAVIGAIGLAVGALTAYFKGSEEGQNRLNKIVQIGTGLFEKFMDVVEYLGEVVFDSLVKGIEFAGNALDGLATILGINTQGVKDFFNEIDKGAEQMANLQASIDERERNLILARSETNLKVAKLRQKAIQEEGAEKKKTIEEAIALERKLVDEEVELAKLRQQLAVSEQARNGDDKEAKQKVVEATAAVIDAEAKRFEATLKFEKQLEGIKDKEAKDREAKNKEIARELELKNQLEQVNARLAGQTEKEIEQSPIIIKGKISEGISLKNYEDALKAANKAKQKEIDINQARLALFGQISQTFVLLAGSSKELAVAGIALERASAISQIISNTGIANAKAVAASPLTLGQPFVGINTVSAGLSIATIVAQAIKSLTEVTAAAGGGDFVTKGPQLMLVGDNPGGRERVTVEPLSGKGRTVVGGNMMRLAGGGVVETQSQTASARANFAFANSLEKNPVIFASWTEGRELSDKITFKEKLVSA